MAQRRHAIDVGEYEDRIFQLKRFRMSQNLLSDYPPLPILDQGNVIQLSPEIFRPKTVYALVDFMERCTSTPKTRDGSFAIQDSDSPKR
jgi:hypothetical protein